MPVKYIQRALQAIEIFFLCQFPLDPLRRKTRVSLQFRFQCFFQLVRGLDRGVSKQLRQHQIIHKSALPRTTRFKGTKNIRFHVCHPIRFTLNQVNLLLPGQRSIFTLSFESFMYIVPDIFLGLQNRNRLAQRLKVAAQTGTFLGGLNRFLQRCQPFGYGKNRLVFLLLRTLVKILQSSFVKGLFCRRNSWLAGRRKNSPRLLLDVVYCLLINRHIFGVFHLTQKIFYRRSRRLIRPCVRQNRQGIGQINFFSNLLNSSFNPD